MKSTLLIPVAGALLALAACSDNEPAQQTSSTNPAPAGTTTSRTAHDELPAQRGTQDSASAKTTGTNGTYTGSAATGTGTTPLNTPPVLRGENAEVVGAAKTNTGTTVTNANGVNGGTTVQHGDQAVTVAPDGSVTRSTTPVSTAAPAARGEAAEANLVPDRDAAAKADAQNRAADDSGRNKREDGTQPTPLDQGNSETDLKITQGIRSSVVERDDLSINAKNAKVITRDGVVTLRGPVANAQERETVASIAKAQAGVTKIENYLEPLQQ